MAKLTKQRYNYSTVEAANHHSKTKWFILLFILMISVISIAAFVSFQYSSIKNAYETSIYHNLLPNEIEDLNNGTDDKTAYTHLVLSLDNVYVEGDQFEDVIWAQMNYVKPEETTIQSVNIPMNLNVIAAEESDAFSLDVYGESGVQGVRDAIEELLQIQIDYISLIRLHHLRDLVDPLESIDVYSSEAVTVNGLEIGEETYAQLTAHQISQLLTETATWEIFQQVAVHQSLYQSIFKELTALNNVTKLPLILTAGEYVISSTLPFSKIVDIYRQDDYNLTDVDLNQLIELESTQVNHQYVYTANLDDLRSVTARMSSAIEEAAMKE